MTSLWNEQVWAMVDQIPPGKVASYGQVAALLGHPRRARHVGFALGRMPAGRDTPWHRVLNGRGKISFHPLSEHFHLQKALLEAENVVFRADGRVDLAIYGWRPRTD